MTEDRRHNFSAPKKTSPKDAMNTAVRILTYRDHSKYELKQKLQQRGFASEVIDTVIVECERLNYIDDQRTARVYISQLKRKCFGKRHIRMALKKKRLSGIVIEKILLENYTEAEDRENASKLLEKKLKTFNREEDFKKRRDKIYRFLYSRGFNKDVITDLIRNLAKERFIN
jgi:regulatory protein